ncbi:peptide ABC transporter substrate-binding protein [Wukongibacter baidiensis]|uniref:peptide ABC transporter substrate-binding protein n=1 Tax=Wukongibacter baidiensis TaxID=1723361 RepID=UPI003D7FF0C2
MKGKKLLSIFLVVVLMATALLAGCGGNKQTATEQPKEEQNTEEQSGSAKESKTKKGVKVVNGIEMDEKQYLNIVGAEPKTMDSATSSIVTSWIAQGPVFEGLTRIQGSPDGDKIEAGVAETWEVSEDGTVYTFHLRKDAMWSDGVPVKAEDFAYAIKRVIDPRTGSLYAWLFTPVFKNAGEVNAMKVDENTDAEIDAALETVGAKAVDDHTLKLELTSALPYFMQLTYFPTLYPQRKDIVEKWGDKYGTELETMVYNGPYVLTEWVHRNKMVYEKNPNYWDKDKVYLDKIIRHDIEEDSSQNQALLTGEVDVLETVRMEMEWIEKLKTIDEINFVSRKYPDVGYHMFNCFDKYFKNVKVRKAFSAALDRDAFISDVRGGVGYPGWEYIPDMLVIGDASYREKVGDTKFVKKLFDEIEDPKALLIEGLKELGEDPDPAKMKVSMMFRGTDEKTKQLAEWYQYIFKEKLGVNMTLELLKYNVAYDKQKKLEFQIFDTGWTGDFNDPSNFIDFWHSDTGYYNYKRTGWKNEEFDKLIEEGASSLDTDVRAKAYRRAEEILVYEDCAIMPYDHKQVLHPRRNYVKELNKPVFGHQDYKGVYTLGRKR